MKHTRPKAVRYEEIPGYVACSFHGEIHEDCLDPYWNGEPEKGEEDMRCKPEYHAPVYERVER